MILITSISPTNIDRQKRAISTWDAAVVSFNHPSEIGELETKFPSVRFIPTNNTGINQFGKHYVSINDFMGWIHTNGSALIINSDIIINGNIIIPQRNELLLYSRYDCVNYNFDTATKFPSGYDAFYLTPELANLIPNSDLYMGQCHWDYLIPYVIAKRSVRIITPSAPVMYHEIHSVQYSQTHWETTAKIFGREVGLAGHPNGISHKAYEFIKSKIKFV